MSLVADYTTPYVKSDGSWPYPFGDVQSVVSNGNSILPPPEGSVISGISPASACSNGDLHLCVVISQLGVG